MFCFNRGFFNDESGAVTVDWVVLCAAIVGLTVLITTAMTDGAVNLGDLVTAHLSSWQF